MGRGRFWKREGREKARKGVEGLEILGGGVQKC